MGGDVPPVVPDISDVLRRIRGDGDQLPDAPPDRLPTDPSSWLPSVDWSQRYTDIIEKLQQYQRRAVDTAQLWCDEVAALAQQLWDAVGELVAKAYQQVESFLTRAAETIGAAPVGFTAYQLRTTWQDVQRVTSNAAAVLSPQQLQVKAHLPADDGRDRYLDAIDAQRRAAQRLADRTASLVGDRLGRLAGYALMFYTGLGALLGSLVSKLATEVLKLKTRAAQASAAGAAPGAGTNFVAVSADAMLTAGVEAIGAYNTLVGSMITWVNPGLEQDLSDYTDLPNNHWPDPHTGNFARTRLA
ncbi:MAG: hypothetical protein J2P15_10180 [Micromonosporaceae bacterium]|nr:hypothetical protein [Micromonosporaceae bacterium]